MPVSLPQIIKRFSENKEHYQKKEIGDGTQGFCRDVLESEIFNLKSGDTKVSGNFRYEATVEGEGDRGDDFILNIDGIIVPVEVEKLNNIQKGESQIEGYMKRKNSLYGILTDGYIWKFYTQGYSLEKPTLILTLDELVTSEGQARKDRVFLKKDYYLNSFSSLSALVAQNSDFVLEDFHNDLIRLAEDVKRDFSTAGAFSFGTSDEEQIKGVYSFIIQFILLKIIQDKKRGLDLLGIDAVKTFLVEEKWNKLTQHIFKKLQFLGEFYTSYRNEQEELLKKIREKYTEASVADYDLEALKPFLDLYVFIIKYNFKKTNSDLFGAVYENYLKELYREDNTKKGQVFTPPEIVEFMLDEVGYTTEYIRTKIEEYGVQKIQKTLIQWAPVGKSDYTPEEIEKQYFNIPGLSIIDPACGSGTFLYKASGRIANAIEKLSLSSREKGLLAESLIINNIVGFDIEAFPLYLAEMNILITLLWHNIDDTDGNILNRIDKQIRVFSTKDSIAEFANSEESIIDTVINSLSNLPEFTTSILSKRDEREILNIYMDIRDVDMDRFREMIQVKYLKTALSPRSPALVKAIAKAKTIEEIKGIFSGSAITDVNETLEKTKFLAEYQKLEKTLLPRLNTKITELLTRHEAQRTKFDFVVGNPPYINSRVGHKWSSNIFGIKINDPKYKKQKVSGDFVNIYGWFYYLGWFLLREKGKICYINPRDLLHKTAISKTWNFIKQELQISRVIDFNESKVFYNRGVEGTSIVMTTATIISGAKIHTIDEDNFCYIKYIGSKDLISIDEIYNKKEKLFRNCEESTGDALILNQDMVTYKLSDYIKEVFGDDLCITTYPKLWKNNDDSAKNNFINTGVLDKYPEKKINRFFNQERRGFGYFQHTQDYIIDYDNLEDFYDTKELGIWIPRRPGVYFTEIDYSKEKNKQVLILNKKFRLNWVYFGGTFALSFDERIISDQGNKMALGINDITKVSELYFLLGICNSFYIQSILDKKYQKICNQRNVENLPFPKIDSPIKESLKKYLIANSEQVIKLAKQLQGVKIIGDILDVEKNGMDTKVSGIKKEYEYVSLVDIGGSIGDISLSVPLSKEAMKQIRNENPLMKKLENERDAIVEQLYGL